MLRFELEGRPPDDGSASRAARLPGRSRQEGESGETDRVACRAGERLDTGETNDIVLSPIGAVRPVGCRPTRESSVPCRGADMALQKYLTNDPGKGNLLVMW